MQELERVMRELATDRLEHGLAIPEPTAAYSGRVLLRMPKGLHRLAEQRAKSEDVSMNQWLISAIARELGPISKRVAKTTTQSSRRKRSATSKAK